jgi:hypothetical protein
MQDSNGFTALIKSCIKGHSEIARMLVGKSDVNIRSRDNKKAIEHVPPDKLKIFTEIFKQANKEVRHD